MTQKANILSFNEVKARGASSPRTVSSRRPSHASNFQIHPKNSSSARTQSSRAVDALRASNAAHASYGSRSYNSGSYNPSSSYSSGYSGRSSSGSSGKSAFGHNWDAATSFADQNVREPSWLKSSSASSRMAQSFSGAAGSIGRSGAKSDVRYSGTTSDARYSGVRYSSIASSARFSGAKTDSRLNDAHFSGARFNDARFDTARDYEEDQRQSGRSRATQKAEKESFTQRMRKKFRSAKAERDFNRTIGARERKAQTDAANAQASRAAVYEMRMGATHRKSARMQDGGKANAKFGFGGFGLPFSLPVASLSAAATRGIVALAVVGLTVFMLYPSCQNYYTETRQLQQLQAEYQALTEYNAQMQSQIDYLNTDEGLEEYARSELGWIREDERMATVEGVKSSVDGSTQANTTYSPLNEEIPAPDTWYSGVLDVFFGYGK